MVAINLPDGSVKEFSAPVTGAELASDIGAGLAKAAVAVIINGELKDLTTTITSDATVSIITTKDDEGIEILRHTCAHVMAQAVQELFTDTQVTIGPSIENGFYYDFAREESFSTEDFAAIEKRMAEIVDANIPLVREEWDRDEAIKFFLDKGEKYKAEIIGDLPEGEKISLYKQDDFADLCRGPHLPSTGKLGKAFKLMKVAGAYWRGNSDNEMLQRIYGTCWADKKQLKAHLTMLEEAEKRDHRKLGKEMDLFHFEDVAPGAVFWHPRGWKLFQGLISYMRNVQEKADYTEINTPEIMDRTLWETSGHWHNYRENMFTTQTKDERVFAIKPMNCPGGVMYYKQGITSYKDLPRRVGEFGKVQRYEPSGALHGLMRLRSFTQDDAHIFCTPEQIREECIKVVKLIHMVYKDFGFDEVKIKLSTRPEKRIGSDEIWDKLENSLRDALDHMGCEYSIDIGGGAFYGPKLDFFLKDKIGREWQCGTNQIDMNLPERFDINYVDANGERQRPIMFHRVLFGSLERFTGILIESTAGHFPFWLSPLQVVVATINSSCDDYAEKVVESLKKVGLRAELDIRNEKINYKIREHSHSKIPVIMVIGDREAEENTVAIRRLGGKTQEILALDIAIDTLCKDAVIPSSIDK
ncbi:MAG: threonine--tRNA ligase [Alphaproteobacteria bacterium]|nr:threonine--tRNA ligase [Alphaproteobacteria bacterium]